MRLALVGAVLALVVGASWPVTATAEPSAETPTGTWVARVEDSDAYVAVVVGKGDGDRRRPAAVYVCDGAQLAEWFSGSTRRARLYLSSETGSAVVARITKPKVTGTVTLGDGTRLPFEARRAKGDAGLYRAEKTVGAAEYLGGWVVLADGTQRGAVRTVTAVVANPLIDPDNDFTVTVPNVGNLRPRQFVDPDPDFIIDPDGDF
jgi:hypothetical protein